MAETRELSKAHQWIVNVYLVEIKPGVWTQGVEHFLVGTGVMAKVHVEENTKRFYWHCLTRLFCCKALNNATAHIFCVWSQISVDHHVSFHTTGGLILVY